MMSALRITLVLFFGLALTHCSSAPKSEGESKEEYPEYTSSGVYDDIEKETGRGGASTEDYGDDSYGDTGDSGLEVGEESSSYSLNGADEGAIEESSAGETALPLDGSSSLSEMSEEKDSSAKSYASVAPFKNGMYKFKSDCNMRAKPTTKASKQGMVNAGKKLWVEAHNDKWVKVYKKSGAVFVSRGCL